MNRIFVAAALSLAIISTTTAATADSTGRATASPATSSPAASAPGSAVPTAPLGHAVSMTPPQLAAQRQTATQMTTAGGRLPKVAASSSTNWSGLVTNAAAGTYQGVSGAWNVPAITAGTANKYSCTWIGVDGWGSSSLIQMGTESDSVGGRPRYYAWLELLPATQTPITYADGTYAPVAPGDSMWSYIYRTSTTGSTWAMYLQDRTKGWTLSTTTTYATRGASAEWVHEATQVGGVVGPPPPFSKVTFTSLEVLENSTWYPTAMTAANEVVLVQKNIRYATPSAPTTTAPQRFSITYG